MASGNVMVEGMPMELDYWSNPPFQGVIMQDFQRDFLPMAAIQENQPIEFYVHGSEGLFLDLNNSKVEFAVQFLKADGGVPDANAVAPINLLAHTIWSTVEIELNGKPMSEPNNLYGYRAMLETLTNYRKEAMDTRMLCEGWIKDTAGKLEDCAMNGANTGLKARIPFVNQGKVVYLVGRPHLDMFHIPNLLPHRIGLRIRFSPAKNPFIIKGLVGAKMKILSAKLHIVTKQISPSLLLAHSQMLKTTNYHIPYCKETLKTIAIPAATQNYEMDNIYMGVLPDLVLLAFVSDAAMAGAPTLNPFNFENFGINYLALKVNGELVPRVPLTPDFTKDEYIKEYVHNLEALGYDKGNHCWNLTPEEWAKGYTIWAFKITPGPIGAVRSAPKTGAIRLEVKFGAALAANISAILLEQHPAILEIDHNNTVMSSS